uniref:Ribonuclease HII n=1 Tax=Thermogemmatispora argillosa TaxID=2045280 RepID=A0A455T380_9CHLR|nr:ribonuclease HII [Thermogemmatispora argillosa]
MEPTLEEELALLAQGYRFVAGLDEAGRGCLAGPVVAAAVILPVERLARLTIAASEAESDQDAAALMLCTRLRDSKQMTPAQRERMYAVIQQQALALGVGIAPVELIDERNILEATRWAMREALAQLSLQPEALLLDALTLPGLPLPQRALIKGDARCLSIAAASVIAKVTRDRLMERLHEEFPVYGFDRHKGYGTEAHLAALRRYGVSPHHRRSFAPVRELVAGLFSTLPEAAEGSLPPASTSWESVEQEDDAQS